MSRVVFALALATLATGIASADQQTHRPAVAVDAITAIIDAFHDHQIVVLGEGAHGNEQGHEFRLALIRDSRFSFVVNDIVVECGNGRYQGLIDRFVQGEAVEDTTFRSMLQDTSYETTACDRPIYGEFYRAVRELNQRVPVDRRLRVLLGAPPVHWELLENLDQYLNQLGNRRQFVFELVMREVVARGRRAVIVYGDGHIVGRRARPPDTIAARLDAANVRVFAISTPFVDLTKRPARRGLLADPLGRAHSGNCDRRGTVPILLWPSTA